MKIYEDINALPKFENAVITIGSFDGVHKGHFYIINQLIQEAKRINGTPIVITFFPHPKKIVGDDNRPVLLLNTLEEKSALLKNAGIEHLVVVPFTKVFSELSAEEYITNFLVSSFHPKIIVTGYDHRFGNNRTGDIKLLEHFSNQFNYVVKEIPEHILQEITISSTTIRNKIAAGEIESANELLGYSYFFSGKVVEGNKIGRTISFPTANLKVDYDNKLIPPTGVYAVTIEIENNVELYYGMMNIGYRPTIGGIEKIIEVNIFDFEELIYNQTLKIAVIKKLRTEEKFDGIDQLKNQLSIDKENALQVFHLIK